MVQQSATFDVLGLHDDADGLARIDRELSQPAISNPNLLVPNLGYVR
ncbi:hypothetical protein SAMN02927923_04540 [Microvirga guangxiensis]|uniref:Uncharacterized protein n=1 Tax=Microvirga guangxiensis TaxID=549386 RepID=A0A1G5LN15_9HYPH|nr:hypothetical protein SAMN02927923_04540 [Microvirga guangxiensis]